MEPILDAAARAAVGEAMRRVADAEIRPRFRALADHHVHLKGPGDYVTEADLEAERALTPLLREILDVPVVGEEATAADPSVVDVLATEGTAWTVDPVDGTANFVEGSDTYAVMVGLVEGGVPVGGWILQPEFGRMFEALQGVGAFLDGRSLAAGVERSRGDDARAAWEGKEPRGAVSVRYAADGVREGLLAAEPELGGYEDLRMCAGFDYADLVTQQVGFLVYTRAKPWDHVPGAAIAAEAGFTVGRLDGSGYRPAVEVGAPLLAARTDRWESIREVLARNLGL
ncbi:inositol monophosphatase family protein [Demequina silvatica]|uniref:inositol monophosphatase family protein n=1 Tax=Demequina silvatica TaxID=1638988 RepID=UPI00078149B7|nr:inositol monophosphatase family protein [Demequina silvatica]